MSRIDPSPQVSTKEPIFKRYYNPKFLLWSNDFTGLEKYFVEVCIYSYPSIVCDRCASCSVTVLLPMHDGHDEVLEGIFKP